MPAPACPLRILVLGRGRVGGALARAWRRAGLAARLLPGRSRPTGRGWDVVVLAVPDASVREVAARLAGSLRSHPLVLHCAGALDLSPLEPLRRLGCAVGSLHPLVAVPTPRVRLLGCAGVAASSPRALRALEGLARAADLAPLEVRGADRAIYHAAAAMASNGVVGLLSRARALLGLCGASERQARGATEFLLLSAFARPLTGPVARGDAEVVLAHLAALRRRSPKDLDLYRALARSQLPLAREAGRASPAALARIDAALRAPDRASSPSRRRAPRGGPAPRHPRPGRASRAPRSS